MRQKQTLSRNFLLFQNIANLLLIMRGILSLALIFGAFSSNAYCKERSQSVNLMIFIEDSSGFTRENFDSEVAFVESNTDIPLRSIFIKKELSKQQRINLVNKALRSDDRISGLILSTHGTTLLGSTHLAGLGLITPFGTIGLLKELMSSLSEKWNKDLFIYLNACTTLCGREAVVRPRLRSLFKPVHFLSGNSHSFPPKTHLPIKNAGLKKSLRFSYLVLKRAFFYSSPLQVEQTGLKLKAQSSSSNKSSLPIGSFGTTP